MYDYNEIIKHNHAKDCWVVLHGKVYDLTLFLDKHPGGKDAILKYAGTDGTDGFDSVHSRDLLDQFTPVGEIKNLKKQSQIRVEINTNLPPLSAVFNLFDFESLAKQILSKQGFLYVIQLGLITALGVKTK